MLVTLFWLTSVIPIVCFTALYYYHYRDYLLMNYFHFKTRIELSILLCVGCGELGNFYRGDQTLITR